MSKLEAGKGGLNRRSLFKNSAKLLVGAGALAAGAHKVLAMESVSKEQVSDTTFHSDTKFMDPSWNRDAFSRLMGNLDFKTEKVGWYSGTVNSVRDGEKVKPLFGFEGFSFTRLVDEGNGVYQKLLREVGFYTDLKTGEILETWHNPFTDENVKVVHIANDPFNFKISAIVPKPPSYGGLNKENTPDIPFLLPWRETGDGSVIMKSNIHLYYPSALQPDKWPRESSGKMNRVSEMFSYIINKEKLMDPNNTSVTYSGAWGRITPWLPWMLMGQADGHIYYDCIMGGYDNMDVVSPKVLAYAKKHYPKYFSAPSEWEDPSYSSLENYAIEQKPAPPQK